MHRSWRRLYYCLVHLFLLWNFSSFCSKFKLCARNLSASAKTLICRSQRLQIGPLIIGNGFFDITIVDCRIISKPTDRVTCLKKEELCEGSPTHLLSEPRGKLAKMFPLLFPFSLFSPFFKLFQIFSNFTNFFQFFSSCYFNHFLLFFPGFPLFPFNFTNFLRISPFSYLPI